MPEMTYSNFVKRMGEYAKNNPLPIPALTDAWGAAKLTGLTTAQARAYLERMVREGKAVREKPHRKVFYTIVRPAVSARAA